jgi:O-antigen ligase
MPPSLALGLSLTFSFFLLVRESRHRPPTVSRATWIPTMWLLILGSRSVSQWLNLQAPQSVDPLLDGSPTDRIVYFALIACALVILWRRRPGWGRLFVSNAAIFMFLGYCVLSVAWSDFPFVAFKRWSKGLGDPLMALVLITEENPAAAIGTVLRRCAFILVPLSIVFIKYFPYLGRGYDGWSGLPSYMGVTTNKNLLGYTLLIYGLYFVCTLATKSTSVKKALSARIDSAIVLLFLMMIAWLFQMSNSMTSLIGLLVASGIVLGLGLGPVRRHISVLLFTILIFGVLFQLAFNVVENVVEGAGRDMTLTGRIDIWESVLALVTNPWVGTGFKSFWLGDRLRVMWDKFPVFLPNQAHNGYLEIYLNLGWIGLALWMCVLFAGYRAVCGQLARTTMAGQATEEDVILAKFGMAFLAAYVLYNVTEATFKGLTFLIVIFFTLAIKNVRQKQQVSVVGLRTSSGVPQQMSGGLASTNLRDWSRFRPSGPTGRQTVGGALGSRPTMAPPRTRVAGTRGRQ